MTPRVLLVVTLALSQCLVGCSVLGLVYGLREVEPELAAVSSGPEVASRGCRDGLDLVVTLADGGTFTGQSSGLRSLTAGEADSMLRILPHPPGFPHSGDSVWLVYRYSAAHLRWVGVDRYHVIAQSLDGATGHRSALDSVLKILREDGVALSPQEMRFATASGRLPSMTNLVVLTEEGDELVALEAIDRVSAYSRGSPLIPVAATVGGLVIDLAIANSLILAYQEGRLFGW